MWKLTDSWQFANPWWLLLIVLIPFFVWWTLRQRPSTMLFSHVAFFEGIKMSRWSRRTVLLVLRSVAWFLLAVAMARPQYMEQSQDVLTRGVDMMLVVDVSTSMAGLDFKPHNRLEAAKDVLAEFVKLRQNDRLGSVVFSGVAYTQCPLTSDKRVLLGLIKQIEMGVIEDGTAIGVALATAIKRLQDSDAKSKLVILFTDGANNAGEIDPLTAAEIAKTLGIKIYTVGIGKHGPVPYPARDAFGNNLYVMVDATFNEEGLKDVAQRTGGQYFRAEDREALRDVCLTIDQMEKTEIKVKEYFKYTEYFMYFVVAALILLLTEYLLRYVWWAKLP